MKMITIAAAAATIAVSLNAASVLAADAGAGNGYATPQTAAALSSGATTNAHYEWQYHYGRHTQFEGQWVLVR